MKMKIIAVGKIKESYLKTGINEYIKRLSPYAQIEVVELLDEPICDDPNSSEIEKVITKEGDKILKSLKPSDFVINLDLNKKELDSIQFATYLDKTLSSCRGTICFVIGGSYGLSKQVKERANDSLSLSKMTFLHQMTRLILLEQIYRAFKILRNETYHK